MNGQYNFSQQEATPATRAGSAVLAIDTGSPIASVAVALDSQITAVRSIEQRKSSGKILSMIDEALTISGVGLRDLDLLLGLRGPGSFTGLRVGLATLQGIHWSLGLRTGTLPTLQVLATLAPVEANRVISCVDGMRGEWLTQEHSGTAPYAPIGEPRISSAKRLAEKCDAHFVGFGVTRLRDAFEEAMKPVFVEPGPLAAQAIRALESCHPDLDPARLAEPLYLRPPAVTVAQPRND